jgi:hypothetical protein
MLESGLQLESDGIIGANAVVVVHIGCVMYRRSWNHESDEYYNDET